MSANARHRGNHAEKNWRLIIVGVGLLVCAAVFFLGMMGMAPKSNDPAALMTTVGQVSGVIGGIGIAMIVVGQIGKKAPAG